jgi:hypothetical protein
MHAAACGFEYHGPKGYIAFSPRISPEKFKAAFTSAAGWGTFSQERGEGAQTETLEVKHGKRTLRTLSFDLPAHGKGNGVVVPMGGAEVATKFVQQENRIAIAPEHPETVGTGESLSVAMRCFMRLDGERSKRALIADRPPA